MNINITKSLEFKNKYSHKEGNCIENTLELILKEEIDALCMGFYILYENMAIKHVWAIKDSEIIETSILDNKKINELGISNLEDRYYVLKKISVDDIFDMDFDIDIDEIFTEEEVNTNWELQINMRNNKGINGFLNFSLE